MKKLFGLMIALALVAGGLNLHAAGAASVEGSWKVSIVGEGNFAMTLVLKQHDKTITGTLSNPHGDPIQLKGQFADGKIAFAGKSSDGSVPDLSATGRLLEDGSLAGDLKSSGYAMQWTAVRTSAEK
jgi:hypothetical protein